MAVDYTVIQAVRQRFGDSDFGGWEADQHELEAPFVGRSRDFAFSCPNVDSGQMAVLQLESFGLSTNNNFLDINGVPVPGGLKTATPLVTQVGLYSLWQVHALLVEANVLAEENVLHIESVPLGEGRGLDNFIIDNVVVFFKTRTRGGPRRHRRRRPQLGAGRVALRNLMARHLREPRR
jgi:hypothetical protein